MQFIITSKSDREIERPSTERPSTEDYLFIYPQKKSGRISCYHYLSESLQDSLVSHDEHPHDTFLPSYRPAPQL